MFKNGVLMVKMLHPLGTKAEFPKFFIKVLVKLMWKM